MENCRKLPWLALAIIVVIGLAVLGAMFDGQSEAKAISQPDLIAIDSLAEQKTLDMPPVVFLHDQHTQAMDKIIATSDSKQSSCSFCHEPGVSTKKFKRQADGNDPKQLEKLYHDNCIGCHMELASAGTDTGPVDGQCRDCHAMRTPLVNTGVKIHLGDKGLHYKHVASPLIVDKNNSEQNCGVCHHVYNEQEQKLAWVKGQEDSCAACHKDKAQPLAGSSKVVGSLKDVSHATCVTCHQTIAEVSSAMADVPTNLNTGPVTCAGCHTLEAQAQYKPVENVERLMRGQPDITVMLPAKDGTKPVVFNHKFHEEVTDSCRTCHHERIDTCTVCHTAAGSKEANYVTLNQAMHTPKPKGEQQSCISCHQAVIAENPNCAGCHVQIKPMSQNSCATCHQDVPGITDNANLDKATLGKAELHVMGEAVVNKQVAAIPMDIKDIPETVTIGSLSKEYQPSIMPHAKINAALQQGMANNKLASAFHTSPTATCAACHHHIAPEQLASPPPCASCHQAETGFTMTSTASKPSLKLAYHQQCMSCHDAMQVKPVAVDCQGCHTPVETSGQK